MYDVAIVGCGVIGAATAYALARYDAKVVVLEAENDVATGTTKANSAILHAGYDPKPGTKMARLNVEGVALAAEICEALDVPRKACGSLVVAFTEAELPTLQTLLAQGQASGVPGLQLLGGAEARALEPNLSAEAVGALYAPTAAIVSPWDYALAMAEVAVKNGVTLCRNTRVTGIEKTVAGWALETTGGAVSARYIVNAAGLGAEALHNLVAPHRFTTQPNRGEYDLLDKSEGARVNHVVFQCPTAAGKGVLVAPTVHGNCIVGPTAEPVAGEDTATTAAGITALEAAAKKSIPSVNLRATIRSFAGVRANTDDPDFIIETAVPGFIDLAGIRSPGLSAAPAIGLEAVRLLQENGFAAPKKAYFDNTRRVTRFAALPPAEKAALAAKKPAYGRVICRCETVTEGEILDAIHTPIPPVSVDGVKRRTGAGMGRCQGGFCGPRVLELLAKESGLPPEKIPQDKAGSNILLGQTKQGKGE
ncbi:MAG: NAD(P)/FAD-dependent oxidoreductase [Gemmiger sp.]|nr:NAD(P)/FAD-dependent oxidoreductase [Gemmiger sp.]